MHHSPPSPALPAGALRLLLVLLAGVVLLSVAFAPDPFEHSPSPPFRLIFIKTHKTASSTLAGILRRVGRARGLRFFNAPDLINLHSFRGVPLAPYDAICNHIRDSPWLDSLVPNGTRVTIVREPVARFVSAWRFFNYEAHLGPLPQLLARCERSDCRNLQVRGKPVFNEMAWMLGVDSPASLHQVLSRITNPAQPTAYQLVLLTDQFDRGLILLQHLLRLNDSELAYTPLKADQAHMTSLLLANLTVPQREHLARLNDWDFAVYRAAHERFEADMAQQWTPKHEQSLMRLRDRRDALSWTCRSSSTLAQCVELRKTSKQLTAESAQAAREHKAAAPLWLTEYVH